MLQVKGMLSKANIHFNQDASIEISHHYGLDRFREYGAVIVTCINREYAKKYVIDLQYKNNIGIFNYIFGKVMPVCFIYFPFLFS